MEQKFNTNRLDLQVLREFCEREGEEIAYRKGDQLEREGDPARWFAFVTEGCFKYEKYGMSDDKAHIKAMMPSCVLRVTGQQLENFFDQSKETMKLRAMIGEHILSQFRSRYLDLHCTTPRERYEMLLQRCPGIMEFLDLQDITSFLNVHPNTVSKIRRDITFGDR